jgi:cyclophilin family peptidyl-prolyl cis-trans isomerase
MTKKQIVSWIVLAGLAIAALVMMARNSVAVPEANVPEAKPVDLSGTTTQAAPAATSTTTTTPKPNAMTTATIQTTKGTIEIEFYTNDAPKAVENFVTLANKGFYDGVIFHRVIEGFMIQGGDPTGTGRGGPGYQFADELDPNTESYKRGYVRGTLAMANAGPDTNGSQFFIMHKDYPLPHNYTIFGRVTLGLDVVDAIATTETGPGDKPVQDIVMTKVTIGQ